MNRQSGRQRQTACGRPFFLCPLVVVSAGRQVAVMLRTIWLYGTGKKCLLETLQSRISTFTCRCVSLQKCQRILHCLIIKSFIPIFHYKSRPSRIRAQKQIMQRNGAKLTVSRKMLVFKTPFFHAHKSSFKFDNFSIH